MALDLRMLCSIGQHLCGHVREHLRNCQSVPAANELGLLPHSGPKSGDAGDAAILPGGGTDVQRKPQKLRAKGIKGSRAVVDLRGQFLITPGQKPRSFEFGLNSFSRGGM